MQHIHRPKICGDRRPDHRRPAGRPVAAEQLPCACLEAWMPAATKVQNIASVRASCWHAAGEDDEKWEGQEDSDLWIDGRRHANLNSQCNANPPTIFMSCLSLAKRKERRWIECGMVVTGRMKISERRGSFAAQLQGHGVVCPFPYLISSFLGLRVIYVCASTS